MTLWVYAIIAYMKTIAENANDFADLRTRGGGDCIYVDKTDYFHRLVTDRGRSLFFIARPRRSWGFRMRRIATS